MASPKRMNTPAAAPSRATTAVTQTHIQDVPTPLLKPTGARTQAAEKATQAALAEVQEFSQLGPNWDSYGGEPPTQQAIAGATELLLTVQFVLGQFVGERIEPDYVAPRPDGGVQIEWSAGAVKVSIQVSSVGTLGYLYIDKASGIRTWKEWHGVSSETILPLIAKVAYTVEDEYEV